VQTLIGKRKIALIFQAFSLQAAQDAGIFAPVAVAADVRGAHHLDSLFQFFGRCGLLLKVAVLHIKNTRNQLGRLRFR